MATNIISNLFFWVLLIFLPEIVFSQSAAFTIQDVKFESQGVTLVGSIITPKNPFAAVVIVHGSDPVKREIEFAKRLAKVSPPPIPYCKVV
jgi:ABC-type spermidine/putrescine transport system permease subunit II